MGEDRPGRFDPPTRATAERFTSGALTVGASQAIRIGTQFLSIVVLARVLTPSEFGVVAMAAPVVVFVQIFAELGLSQATIQKQDLTHNQASWLFCVTAAAGLALATLTVAISPLVGMFYEDERAAWVCAVMATGLVLGGLTSQHAALLIRAMRYRVLALVDVTAAVVTLVASLATAYFDAGYWAIVIGMLTGSLVKLAGTWMAMPWVPSKPYRDPQLRSFLAFGGGMTAFSLANYIARNLDNVLIGRQWGAGDLGLYDLAYKLLVFPLTQVLNPLASVVLPTLSRLQDDHAAYRRVYMQICSQVLLITLPGLVAAVTCSELIVVLLLGEQWTDVVPIFTALGAAAIVQPLINLNGWLLVSYGRTNEYAMQGVAFAVLTVVAFAIALPFGIIAMAIAFSIASVIRVPLIAIVATRSGPVRGASMANLVLYASCIVGVAISCAAVMRSVFDASPMLAFLGTLVLGYLGALGISLVFAWPRRSIGRAVRVLATFCRRTGQVGAKP